MSRKNQEGAQRALANEIKNTFALQLPVERFTAEALEAALQNDITEKETLAGKENFNMFIRYQYVQVIDKKWLDQLEALEGLREAVSLRSYGSKNPLTEYKIDGFNLFDEMLDDIRQSVMSRVFKVRIQLSPQAIAARQASAAKKQSGMNAQHQDAESITRASQGAAGGHFNAYAARQQAANGAMQKHTSGQTVTVRRTTPKVGRNDPCPCGSGKKYKKCCGRDA